MMVELHKGLPVSGYTEQSSVRVAIVNTNKVLEERMLRAIDLLNAADWTDKRCLALARTHIETGCMYLNRAVFKPTRVRLPEDPVASEAEAPGLPPGV